MFAATLRVDPEEARPRACPGESRRWESRGTPSGVARRLGREPISETRRAVTWPERRIGAAAVILDDARRVLLVRHTYGRHNWELPGGVSEAGESVIETVVREVREEVGVDVAPDLFTRLYWEPELDAHHFVFLCRILGEATPTPSSDEISTCGDWPLDSLPRPLSDFTVQRITDALIAQPTELALIEVPTRSWLE
jgi:8-oxo-dGTP diphosphatase